MGVGVSLDRPAPSQKVGACRSPGVQLRDKGRGQLRVSLGRHPCAKPMRRAHMQRLLVLEAGSPSQEAGMTVTFHFRSCEQGQGKLAWGIFL